MPEGVAQVAAEERVIDLITLPVEPGVIGGIPAGGLNFGAAVNAQAVIDQPDQFDFYGGGLDIAFLGLALADAQGNVNVSQFGSRLAGAGGCINISQNARTVVFVGSFLALVPGEGGALQQHGQQFVPQVEQLTFSGAGSLRCGQRVRYVTERCVFALQATGSLPVEVAPGLDIDRDIVGCMGFRPVMDGAPVLMDAAIFQEAPMGLRERLLRLPLAKRLHFDAAQQTLVINFEHLAVRSGAISTRCGRPHRSNSPRWVARSARSSTATTSAWTPTWRTTLTAPTRRDSSFGLTVGATRRGAAGGAGIDAVAPLVRRPSGQLGGRHPCRGLWTRVGAGMLRPSQKAGGMCLAAGPD